MRERPPFLAFWYSQLLIILYTPFIMSDFTEIINQVTGALAGNKDDKAGLYGLLFGNKEIPVKVGMSQETEIIILAAFALLAGGAVAVAFVLKR